MEIIEHPKTKSLKETSDSGKKLSGNSSQELARTNDTIERLFVRFGRIFGKAFTNHQNTDGIRREWWETIHGLRGDQLEAGLRRAQRHDGPPPNCGKFYAWCTDATHENAWLDFQAYIAKLKPQVETREAYAILCDGLTFFAACQLSAEGLRRAFDAGFAKLNFRALPEVPEFVPEERHLEDGRRLTMAEVKEKLAQAKRKKRFTPDPSLQYVPGRGLVRVEA